MTGIRTFDLRQLSDVVREHRLRGNWTQDEVAARADISVGSLRDVEQGRIVRPRVTTLRGLAEALDLSGLEATELIQLGRRGPVLAQDFCLRLLGPVSMQVKGATVNLGSVRQRTILALLGLKNGSSVGRVEMVDVIWGGEPPATAAELIQTYVARVRQRMQQAGPAPGGGDVALVAAGGGYRLDLADDQLDVVAFRALAEVARRHCRAGDLELAFLAYRQALGLWSDDPLADLPGLQEHPVVTALVSQRHAALQEWADVSARLGRQEELLPLLRSLADRERLDEGMHARLMIALAGTGQQAAALQVYQIIRLRLVTELGVEPGSQLRGVQHAILSGRAAGLSSGHAMEKPVLHSASLRRVAPKSR
ncbi:BTAD domain-containing putative transcriptional regulator [Amycolatopsis sp. DG1A-15b]|uniref:BTAD domain-containing putative transcriptional regulator n=1 Tax=Amycolatopsis sp. DG1A-15b TaxID=3052846 RepID=UPI00255BCB49|nr:BTAD domain-containing putative transcriptional regulator [Amycolatopsis sp. DG1A-15b]WIX92569.1 BTAD domain-containing putative transcriptional regulator [Amycolatopsis sp. DG1A-15b]